MCLGIPGIVVKKLSDMEALVDFGGVRRVVDALLVDVQEGDYVIVHAGTIIGKIDKEAFESIIKTLSELAQVNENERP
ncbi:MAG: HypC/HybG/HupF family hydrogenase formation chaperone [Candidatus Korarchaeota archaeon]|nr:HypC/HybG/HupF family hydrogenase formation chaperone [Thermoproteota archaeon]MCR8487757.1 HypC/HybG/HupF family hydrogenase formation chaperone [Thermoproteota archaeon]